MEVSSTLLSDASSCEEPSIRSRLILDTSRSSVDSSAIPEIPSVSFIAYVPWVLLGVLGVLLITLVVAVARPAKPAATVDYSEPNFDSIRPAFVPSRPVVEGPTIREEEDAFIIEDPVDAIDDANVDAIDDSIVDTIDDSIVDTIDSSIVDTIDDSIVDTIDSSIVDTIDSSIVDTIDDSINNPHVEEMDISVANSEPVTSEESIVDLGDTVSGSSLQGSMIAVLFVSCLFSSLWSHTGCLALWYRYQSKSEVHEPVPITPARRRSDPIPPMTTGLPPITPCPDSLEMNRRAPNSFVL